jgi:hypothetical protein
LYIRASCGFRICACLKYIRPFHFRDHRRKTFRADAIKHSPDLPRSNFHPQTDCRTPV